MTDDRSLLATGSKIENQKSKILSLDSIASTQGAARELLRAGDRDCLGVIASYQAEGRGRDGRRWLAEPGTCLLATYILRDLMDDANPGQLAIVAAVAVAEAIEQVTGLSPRVKWPNDLLLGGRKVAGILIELVAEPPRPAALIGIGINANVERFPADLQGTATSLLLESGQIWPIDSLESAVCCRLFAEAGSLAAGGDDQFAELLARWRMRDATEGVRYIAQTESGAVQGAAVGISDSGGLILQTESGSMMEALSATSVSR